MFEYLVILINTCISMIILITIQNPADPSGCAVEGVGLRQLGCWDRVFESRSGYGCLYLVLMCCVVLCR
jgi:hypothetical protein